MDFDGFDFERQTPPKIWIQGTISWAAFLTLLKPSVWARMMALTSSRVTKSGCLPEYAKFENDLIKTFCAAQETLQQVNAHQETIQDQLSLLIDDLFVPWLQST